MKILHTSDWHLGRSLYGRKRYEEFSSFLDWLAQTIEDEKVDALLEKLLDGTREYAMKPADKLLWQGSGWGAAAGCCSAERQEG